MPHKSSAGGVSAPTAGQPTAERAAGEGVPPGYIGRQPGEVSCVFISVDVTSLATDQMRVFLSTCLPFFRVSLTRSLVKRYHHGC